MCLTRFRQLCSVYSKYFFHLVWWQNHRHTWYSMLLCLKGRNDAKLHARSNIFITHRLSPQLYLFGWIIIVINDRNKIKNRFNFKLCNVMIIQIAECTTIPKKQNPGSRIRNLHKKHEIYSILYSIQKNQKLQPRIWYRFFFT